ncbi:uncharacterized protein LOC101864286 [Aplysia californica]|uniref:Uncharacterized protein LOC101864286 n=1 Tax=Aplysia californica TaxID=6500 RepID=A0ABM0JF63_APLCA|nr:uncharacterized protein LOC101864286 [Aplysia californica]
MARMETAKYCDFVDSTGVLAEAWEPHSTAKKQRLDSTTKQLDISLSNQEDKIHDPHDLERGNVCISSNRSTELIDPYCEAVEQTPNQYNYNESDPAPANMNEGTSACMRNFSELLRELGQESRMVILQYSQTFGDSEDYEQQASQALSDLDAHAKILDQMLQCQKDSLCGHLNSISEALRREL